MREDRRARHIADSPFWWGRLGCRKRPALAELKSEEAVRHPSRRRGGVRVAGLSHDKRQGSSRRARSTTAMFSEDDRCAIGMRSAGRAKRRTSPQIPRRSSALREWRDRNPATSGGRKTCPNREQSPPCPTSVGPPIVGGRAGRPLASDERDELPPSVPLGLGGRERCAEPAPVPSSDCPSRQIARHAGFGPFVLSTRFTRVPQQLSVSNCYCYPGKAGQCPANLPGHQDNPNGGLRPPYGGPEGPSRAPILPHFFVYENSPCPGDPNAADHGRGASRSCPSVSPPNR